MCLEWEGREGGREGGSGKGGREGVGREGGREREGREGGRGKGGGRGYTGGSVMYCMVVVVALKVKPKLKTTSTTLGCQAL